MSTPITDAPRTALAAIEASAAEVLSAYPLAAGLGGVLDVTDHLAPGRALLPSCLDSQDALDPHAPACASLLDASSRNLSVEQSQYRVDQTQRAVEGVGEQDARTIMFKQPSGATWFRIRASNGARPSEASEANDGQLADAFVATCQVTLPAVADLSIAATSVLTTADSDDEAFFNTFLTFHTTPSRCSPLSTASTGTLTRAVIEQSSPDPLRLESLPRARPSSSAETSTARSRLDLTTPSRAIAAGTSQGPREKHTTDSERAQLTGNEEMVVDGISPVRRGTDTTPTPGLGHGHTLGVESAVKRIRLSSASVESYGLSGKPSSELSAGTGRGKVRSSVSKAAVAHASELVDKITSSYDSLSGRDTSAVGLDLAPPYSDPAGPSSQHAQVSLFEPSSNRLSEDTLSKLEVLLARVEREGRAEDLVDELEGDGLARLLRVLESVWCDGSDGGDGDAPESEAVYWDKAATLVSAESVEGRKGGDAKGKGRATVTPSPSKKGRGKSTPTQRSRSRSGSMAGFEGHDEAWDVKDEGDGGLARASDFWTLDALDRFSTSSDRLASALLAATCALSVLSLSSLPPRLYPASLLESLVATLRQSLSAFVLPIVSAAPGSPLAGLRDGEGRAVVRRVFDRVERGLHGVEALVRGTEVGEELRITVGYLALAPFFVDASPVEAAGKGKRKALGAGETVNLIALRRASTSLIATLWSRHEEMRGWILEEVLSNVGRIGAVPTSVAGVGRKGEFRLRTGNNIQTVSALLIGLVQTLPADLRRIMSMATSQVMHTNTALDVEMENDVSLPCETEASCTRLEAATRDILDPALESSMKSARTIINYLIQKSCKVGKSAAGSIESDYRAAFDYLVSDLITTLHLPEWPGSEWLLIAFSKSIISALADTKSSHETNALRSLALDHVGALAAKIRMDLNQAGKLQAVEPLRSMQEAVADGDLDSFDRLVRVRGDVTAHLLKAGRMVSATQHAADFSFALLGRELAQAIQVSNSVLQVSLSDKQADSKDSLSAASMHARLQVLASTFWSSQGSEDFFAPSVEESQAGVDALVVQLSASQPIAALYPALLEQVLVASDASTVSSRTKSLRALSLIVAQDPELFVRDDIQRCVESRMLDSSPAVRDSAIELLGKYVVSRPDLAAQYLPQISDRSTDMGLGVRRRAVKLLKTLYRVLPSDGHRVHIARKLVWRVLDEDDGIRDLAVDTIEELWFPVHVSASGQDHNSHLDQLSHIIMIVVGEHKDRPPPVEEVLRLILAKHVEKGTAAPLECLREVMESLIDGLVEDASTFNLVNCIKTIYIINSAAPSLLTSSKAAILLPFLKSATTADEQLICDYLLKIFRCAVVVMPRAASKFAKDLQGALLPMLNRPSFNTTTLQEIVSCFCAVVRRQTHDYATMIKVFRASAVRLHGEVRKLSHPSTASSANVRALAMLCYLSALLCEHGDFDQVRIKFPGKSLGTREAIDHVTTMSTSEYVFETLTTLYHLPVGPAIQASVLTSLGFVYRAHPTLMLHGDSTTIMDSIFSGHPQGKVLLFRILQDFLSSQERAPAAVDQAAFQAGNQADELVGNVDGFADSGVASAICQRYIKEILAASVLPSNSVLQRIAIEILTSVARSGFSHPLSISPTLIALTASPESHLANKASATLTLLWQKHSTLLATRFAEPAKVTFEYLMAVHGGANEAVRGYTSDPPVSCFDRWYSLLKDKRPHRLDFLKTLTHTFSIEPDSPCSAVDVAFARFTAEALGSLDYKTQEEVWLVVSYLNAALAVSGLQVLHLLEGAGNLLGPSGISPNDALVSDQREALVPDTKSTQLLMTLTLQSIICGLSLLLRDHLKTLYSVNDVKMSKYTVGKKSTVGDRAAMRRVDVSPTLDSESYSRLPFAMRPLLTREDAVSQRDTYISLIAEDGTVSADFEDDV